MRNAAKVAAQTKAKTLSSMNEFPHPQDSHVFWSTKVVRKVINFTLSLLLCWKFFLTSYYYLTVDYIVTFLFIFIRNIIPIILVIMKALLPGFTWSITAYY